MHIVSSLLEKCELAIMRNIAYYHLQMWVGDKTYNHISSFMDVGR